MNRKYPHFAIPEIYGESLSYYEVLKKLTTKMNELIVNYDTIPDQIAEAVKNLDASQLFSEVIDQLIDSIATDNTKSTNAVKVYKKHDLLYATFNGTVNLYESLIDFTTGSETELIIGTNIREVNISELLIELRNLIDNEAQAREQADQVLQTNIDNEAQAREQADQVLQTNIDNEINTLRTMLSSPYNFKGDVASISALPASGEVNDTYYVQDVKYKVTWTGSEWAQSSFTEADYQTELGELKSDLINVTGISYIDKSEFNIGGYLKVDGTLVTLSDTNVWVSSDYIEVSDLNKIYYKLHGLNTSSGIKIANVVFYDVNKTKVDDFSIQETTGNNGTDYARIIDVPAYCKYIRLCTFTVGDYEVMCIKNNELMPNTYDATNYFTSQNGFINPNGVFKEVTNGGWYTTDYINVSEFNRIDYNLKGSNAVSVICVYNSSYNLINKVVPTSSKEEPISGTLDITNGKYIRLCSYGYVGKNLLYSVVNKEAAQWENIVNKPYLFNGKNALFFGDSITKGYINANEITENSYPKLFSDSVGMNYTNYGVAGATLSRVSGYGCIYDQISGATLSNADIIFVAGGVNDWQLGVSLSDFRTSVTNICNYLKSNFNGEVIFITPIENAGWNPLNTPVADIDDYRNIISEVALTNGFSLINGKTLDFPNKNGNALMISQLFGDKLHPTEKGYEQYAKGLRSILC